MNTQTNYAKNNKQYEDIDEKELFKEYSKTKNLKIRDMLINKYLYIAKILSKKYVNKGIDYEDIYQVACLGLIYAVDRFDVEKGYEFSSFATPTIIGEIKKYFRDKGWAVRVPRRIQELSKKINNAKLELNQKHDRAPKVKEIAQYLKCTEEEVLEAMEASKVYNSHSLDASLDSSNDEDDIVLSSFIGEEDKYFSKIENRDFLLKSMNKLDQLEKKILKDRYFKRKTQADIAKEVGVSQMTISRTEKKIIKKFRDELKKIYNS